MAYFENSSRKLKRKKHRLWQRTVLVLAMIVVFITTYMLILPAITLTIPTCGLEEHTHSEDCYETVYYDGEGNQITAEEAAEIIAAEKAASEAEETSSGSAVEADKGAVSLVRTEKVLICGLKEHTHTSECFENSTDTSASSDVSSSSETDEETSGSALAADSSAAEETEEAQTASLDEEAVSGSALTIDTISLMNILLASGNTNHTPVVTITMSDDSSVYTNDTTSVTLEDGAKTVDYQPYYTFDSSYYILEAEIKSNYSGKDDLLSYVEDYYNGYYSNLYAFIDIHFTEVTVTAYSSSGSEITDPTSEIPAYYIYEETGDTVLLSGLLGSEEELEIKIEYALTSSSGVSETEMWMALVSEDDDDDFHRGDLTEVKILYDSDGTVTGTADTPYGTEYSVFTSVTDAYDSSVCYIMAKIYGGYISDFSIYASSDDENSGTPSITDGTSYWDDTPSSTDSTAKNGTAYAAGDDTGGSNGIVRTFDTIKYEPTIYFGARGSDSVSTDGENLVVEAEIYKSLAEARFDINVSGITSNMTWLNYAEDYYIEYLYIPKDSSGNAYTNAYGEPIECFLMYEDKSGNKYRSRSDAASGTNKVSVNDLIYGSEGSSGTLSCDSAGDTLSYTDSGIYNSANAYKYDISGTTVFDEEVQAEIEALLKKGSIEADDIDVNCQRLVASIPVQDIPAQAVVENITSASQSSVTLQIGVYVMAAKNGDTFRPKLSAYFYDNPDNLSDYNVLKKESDTGYEILTVDTSASSTINSKTVGTSNSTGDDVTSEIVTVSAKASYNIQLGRNGSLNYLSTFDLDTGQEATSSSSSSSTVYGRMLGYGVTLQLLGDDTDGSTKKGLKGLELPVGETTLNLNFSLSGTVNGTALSNLTYSENTSSLSSSDTEEDDEENDLGTASAASYSPASSSESSTETITAQTAAAMLAVSLTSGTDEELTETISSVLLSSGSGENSGISTASDDEDDEGTTTAAASVSNYVTLKESSAEDDSGSALVYTKAWTFKEGTSAIDVTADDTAEGIIGEKYGSYYPTLGSSDYLRMRSGAQILIPVASSSVSGTISIASSQTLSSGDSDRYYYLVKAEDYADDTDDIDKSVPILYSGVSGLKYNSEYLYYYNGTYYLILRSADDCKKITNITVTYTVDLIKKAFVYFPGSESDYTVSTTEISDISYVYGEADTEGTTESTAAIAYDGTAVFTLGSRAALTSITDSSAKELSGVGIYTTSVYGVKRARTITVSVPDDVSYATLNVWIYTDGTRCPYLSGFSSAYDENITDSTGDEGTVITYTGLSAGTTYTFQCYSYSSSDNSYSPGASYGLYGISLTTVSVGSSAAEADDSQYQMTPLLWDYRSNSNATSVTTQTVDGVEYTDGEGNWKRNIDWDDANNRTNHARSVAPYNSASSNFMLDDTKTGGETDAKECFYGGRWYVSEDNKITSVNDIDYNNFTSSYPVTVSLYTFDFDTYKTTWPTVTSGTYPFLTHRFPINNGGSSSTVDAYENYLFCYSAGYFQVLVPLPESANANSTSLTLTASVSDGTVTSLSNAAENASGSSNETTAAEDVSTGESVDISTAIDTLKYNSFMNRIDESNGGYYDDDGYLRDSDGNLIDIDITTSQEMFMGTKWSTYGSDHDASAVAGDTIDLWGAVISVTGTDHILTAANLLQIFDSAAFDIAGKPEAGYAAKKTVYTDTYNMFGEKGEINFLYVADTAYTSGYDSTNDTIFEYMKTVREDTSTLLFYTSLDALEDDGYTCVGIYMEIRNAYIKQGNYVAFRIPVTVKATNASGGSTINNVYCTMNQSRVWTYISGFPQANQPMYYSSTDYDTSRYSIASNNSGVYANSSGSYDDSEFYSSSWFTTSSGEDNSSVNYLSPKSATYTDDEGDKHTGYYLVQNVNTVTDSGNYGYYKTEYNSPYTASGAGSVAVGSVTSGSTTKEYNHYHNTKSDYSRTSSAYTRGMSLLITGYESTLDISSTSDTWSKSNGDSPEFVISGIMAYNASYTAYSSSDTTNLKVTVDIGDNLTLDSSSANITIGKTAISPIIVENDDGTYAYNGTTYNSLSAILDSSSYTNAAKYTFISGSVSYTVYLYAVISSDGSTLTLYIYNMPFDVELSDISFNTEITTTATSASSTLTAAISGEGDLRVYNTSYNTSESNEAAVSVSLASVAATGYVKYAGENGNLNDIVELDADSLTYKISYTNGEQTGIESFSIFDIFPYDGDGNGTDMVNVDSSYYDSRLTLKTAALTVSGSSYTPAVTYYYTTASPQISGGDIEALLTNYSDTDTLDDGFYNYDYLDTVFISGNSKSSYKYGTLSSTTGFGTVTASTAVGSLTDGPAVSDITGICVNIKGDSSSPAVPSGSTIELTLTFENTVHTGLVSTRDTYGYTAYSSTEDIEIASGDKYINTAYIKTDEASSTEKFSSTNTAGLGVLAREISGRAFVDRDHSGTYDSSSDTLLAEVGVDLYKWNSSTDKYEKVTTSNLLITPDDGDYSAYFSTVTDSNGYYHFYGLPEGYYIVAFYSTDSVTLTRYDLAEYQVGSDTTIDSDAVSVSAITDTDAKSALSGGYVYAIQYSSGQSYIKLEEGSYSNVSTTGLVSASNDIGLDSGYSLPDSGGPGSAANVLRISGTLLSAIGAAQIFYKKHKKLT